MTDRDFSELVTVADDNLMEYDDSVRPNEDKPIPGKQYRLTSASKPCIALGNSWEESRVR